MRKREGWMYEQSESIQRESFQDQLAKLLSKRYPEASEESIEQREIAKTKIEARERHTISMELQNLLREYELEAVPLEKVGEIEFDSVSEDDSPERETIVESVYRLPVVNHFTSNRLPRGYGYGGGAARSLLLRNLRVDVGYMPRDLDVVRLASDEPYENADAEVSKEFMPDDYRHGHGVEPVADRAKYFKTRDLTINEVIATDEEVIATGACIRDTVRHIIRVTEFERSAYSSRGELGSKMLAKTLRFYTESIARYDDAAIEDIEDYEFEDHFISPFWLALQLDKACEVSSEVAMLYVQELKKRKQLPEEIIDVGQAASHLKELMFDDSFYYRHAPTGQFELEQRWDAVDEEYEHLPSFRGFGRGQH